MEKTYAPQKPRDLIITDNYLSLAEGIFKQALYDASNRHIDPRIRAEAIRWIKADGYWFLNQMMGMEVNPIHYIEMVREVQTATKPVIYQKRTDLKVRRIIERKKEKEIQLSKFTPNKWLAYAEGKKHL